MNAPLSNEKRVPKYADEAAFPRDAIKSEPKSEQHLTLLPAQWGLTKRELFAAMCMQGALASGPLTNLTPAAFENAASIAVMAADALLTALENTP